MMAAVSQGRGLLLCLALCAAVACKPAKAPTTEAQPEASATPPAAAPAALASTCPVQVPATAVTVVNTKDGVAMYFTTTARNVGEVRRRVATLAKIAITSAVAEERPEARGAEVPYWEASALPFMVPMHVLAEDVPDGARIVMTPTKVADLDNLRSYALRHGESMQLGRCSADFLKGRAGGPVAAESSEPASADTLG